MPGRDDAAHEAALLVDNLDVGRGAQVDDHDRRALELDGGNGVSHAVGADLGWVVVAHREPRLDAGPHDDGLAPGDASRDARPALGKRRHDRGDNHVIARRNVDIVELELPDERKPHLIGGVLRARREDPVGHELLALEEAHGGLRVSDVHGQKHAFSISQNSFITA